MEDLETKISNVQESPSKETWHPCLWLIRRPDFLVCNSDPVKRFGIYVHGKSKDTTLYYAKFTQLRDLGDQVVEIIQWPSGWNTLAPYWSRCFNVLVVEMLLALATKWSTYFGNQVVEKLQWSSGQDITCLSGQVIEMLWWPSEWDASMT